MAGKADLAVTLQARTGGFAQRFKTARGTVGKFASFVKSKLSGMGGLFLGLAAALGAAKFVGMVSGALKTIEQTAKLSRQIGITTQDLGGLRFAAQQTGGDFELLDKALLRMSRRVALAADETGAGKRRLDALGVSAKSLVGLDAGEQFRRLADDISKLPTVAERGAAAFELFGMTGQRLLPLLAQGRAGIDAFVKEAEKLGVTVSPVDAAKAELAIDAMGRLQSMFSGIQKTVAIELAPFITALTDKITEMGGGGKTAGDFIRAAMGFAGKGIALVADVVHTLKLGFLAVRPVVTKLAALQVTVWATVGKAIQSVLNLLPGFKVQFGDTLKAVAEDLHKLSGEQFAEFRAELSKAPPSEKINAFIDDLKKRSKAAAEEAAKTAGERGAFDSRMERFKKMAAAAKSIFEGTRTPMEKFKQDLQKLQALKLNPFSGLTEDTFQRQLKKLQERARQAAGLKKEKEKDPQFEKNVGIAALTRGSRGAAAAINAAILGSSKKKPEEKTAKNSQKLVDFNRKMTAFLETIASQTADSPELALVEF